MENRTVPKVLIACEESQVVCIEMRKLGIEAYSCDILPCSGGHPEWHIQGDVLPLLNGNCTFLTMVINEEWKGRHWIDGRWDMIIAHPPCTDLASSGARWFPQKIADGRQQRAIDFFLAFTRANCSKIVIENPVGIMSTIYRQPDQIIQPYEFGDKAKKKTCLWEIGVPLLIPTKIVEPELVSYQCKDGRIVTFSADYGVGYHSAADGKRRSKTYPGIARALASQYGGLLLQEYGLLNT